MEGTASQAESLDTRVADLEDRLTAMEHTLEEHQPGLEELRRRLHTMEARRRRRRRRVHNEFCRAVSYMCHYHSAELMATFAVGWKERECMRGLEGKEWKGREDQGWKRKG